MVGGGAHEIERLLLSHRHVVDLHPRAAVAGLHGGDEDGKGEGAADLFAANEAHDGLPDL
jgi:hypothetical protein